MRNVSRIGIMMFAVAALATAVAAGCASTPLKTEESTSGIRAAEEVGAADVPQASLHLLLAKEELAKAKVFSANDQPEKAESMLARSEADAELAVALSREDTEKSEAREAVKKVHELRAENK